MLQCLHNRRFLFRRALRHFGIFLLRQIIVLPNIQPTFPLDLGDVQRRYLQTGMLQHIRFNLLIGRTLLEPGHIHVLQRKLHTHFLRVDFSLGKQDNRLHMVRVREHVDGLDLFDAVAALCEEEQVAGERFRVAGDVDDARRRERDGGGEERLVAARARRVHQEHVAALAVLRHVHHEFARVGADEADVFHVVQLGVGDGVAHGVAVDLHAEHLPGGFGGDHADRADAAVRVDDGLPAGQPGEFHRLAVEHLGLRRVDLVKRLRRNAELQPAEHVRDEAGAVERLFARAEQHRGVPVVHVLHDGRDLRVQL